MSTKKGKIKSGKLNKARAIRRQLDFYLIKNNILEKPNASGIKLNYKIKLFFDHLNIYVGSEISLKNKMMELYEDEAFEYLKAHYTRPELPFPTWKRLREQVFQLHGRICKICGSEENIAVDHILPYSKFPELASDLNNLQPLCRSCNSKKSNKIY